MNPAYRRQEFDFYLGAGQLPPGIRKAGTVGPAAGPEVAVMDDQGNLLDVGEVGEIVIRGPNVTPGYDRNPEANAKAFTRWFRTGDQGFLDADGRFTLSGRLKEIINRAGEKISPKEVDEVLMDHPAVPQVVTFAVPHEKLGEEVAAAVVLREGMSATPAEIREFAATRLADFKVPRTVLLLDEIPKGPSQPVEPVQRLQGEGSPGAVADEPFDAVSGRSGAGAPTRAPTQRTLRGVRASPTGLRWWRRHGGPPPAELSFDQPPDFDPAGAEPAPDLEFDQSLPEDWGV